MNNGDEGIDIGPLDINMNTKPQVTIKNCKVKNNSSNPDLSGNGIKAVCGEEGGKRRPRQKRCHRNTTRGRR